MKLIITTLLGFALVLESSSNSIFDTKYSNSIVQTVLNEDGQLLFKLDAAAGCQLCEDKIDETVSLRKNNGTKEVMINHITQLCLNYTSWGDAGCSIINIHIDIILYILDNRANLTGARFCAIAFQDYSCTDPDADDWIITLPDLPENPAKREISDNNETLHILQITDVHVDPDYTPGSLNKKCSQPLCCEVGIATNQSDAAGFWGDYEVCDMPEHSLDDMLQTIQKQHEDFDYIYFTGDIVRHRSWDTTVESNTEVISTFYNMLQQSFGNVTVYPVLGNHEAHPSNYYSPDSVDRASNLSTQWLYDLISEEWLKWLPKDTQTTLAKGGFYTVSVKPGFRLIALNSNVCYTSNLWLIYENIDMYDQLEWLVDVLIEAEKNAERVHILSHIPSGDDSSSCVKVWSKEYKKIVLRFQNTISAIFNGHTHQDEFKLYFNDTGNDVKLVAYNGASFTTFVGNNPNYRVYDVDSSNLIVTDYHQYVYNLTEANLNATTPPSWFKLYSFKDAYNLEDLTLGSLGSLYTRMTSNDTDNSLVEQYYRYMFRNSDAFADKTCNVDCKKKLVCLIAAGDTTASIGC